MTNRQTVFLCFSMQDNHKILLIYEIEPNYSID